MKNRILKNRIEKQFGIKVGIFKVINSTDSNKILKQYKVI